MKKCYFGRYSAEYLGYLISGEGIRPNPDKVLAVQNLARPTNVSEVRAFNGMVGYYGHFIPQLSKITAPLYQLLRKNIEFKWTSAHQQAFNTLKQKFITSPVLSHPDFDKAFVLHLYAKQKSCQSLDVKEMVK